MIVTDSSSDEEVLRRVREIVAVVSGRDLQGVEVDGNLFDRGILQSITMVGTAVEIEKRFKIRLPIGDFDTVHFSSLGAIARLIERNISKSG